jgi:hypothetical protein
VTGGQSVLVEHGELGQARVERGHGQQARVGQRLEVGVLLLHDLLALKVVVIKARVRKGLQDLALDADDLLDGLLAGQPEVVMVVDDAGPGGQGFRGLVD